MTFFNIVLVRCVFSFCAIFVDIYKSAEKIYTLELAEPRILGIATVTERPPRHALDLTNSNLETPKTFINSAEN